MRCQTLNKTIDNSKSWQALPKFGVRRGERVPLQKRTRMNASLANTRTRALVGQMRLLAEELQGAPGRVALTRRSSRVKLPDEQTQVILNPMERTLYWLFLAHPEGISACNLLLHWKELCEIYARESWFDDPAIREEKLESLCAEDKKVFYATVSRIKKKFVTAVGPWRAEAYIIKKNAEGLYCLKAQLFK